MIFWSRITDMTFNIRNELLKRHPVTGDVIERVPAIVANFGQHLGEFTYADPDTGQRMTGAEIRGHFFDTEAAQKQHGWSDEEREMVERHLLERCESMPEFVQLHSEARAEVPWPTYDKAHHNSIAGLADQLGLVDAALAYERQNKNRESVIQQLEEKKAEAQAEQDLVAA